MTYITGHCRTSEGIRQTGAACGWEQSPTLVIAWQYIVRFVVCSGLLNHLAPRFILLFSHTHAHNYGIVGPAQKYGAAHSRCRRQWGRLHCKPTVTCG